MKAHIQSRVLGAIASLASLTSIAFALASPHASGAELAGERNFAQLINQYSQGKPAQAPWAGSWWPYTKYGTAAGDSHGKSALGKYDAARGGTTRAQEWEVQHHGPTTPGVQGWWGHSNGWSAAAVLFPEPRKPVTVNGIEFSVADIKALLSEAAMNATGDFFGERVESPSDMNGPKYDDVVPGQYFLVLTNYMGKHGKGLVIDRNTGPEVWSQPVAGYRFEYPKLDDYLGEDPERKGIYRIVLTSTIWWAEDAVPADILTPPFEFKDEIGGAFSSRTLKMELWLDGPVVFDPLTRRIVSSGNVIVQPQGSYYVGGKWLEEESTLGHPDYIWVPYSVIKPTEDDLNTNPQVDLDWIQKHLLSGGVDDPSVQPKPVEPAPDASTLPGSNPSPGQTPIPVPPVKAIAASGWSSIEISTPERKVSLSLSGHLSTDRNSCQQVPGSQPLNPLAWNEVAALANLVANGRPLDREVCASYSPLPHMEALELFLSTSSGQKRPLYRIEQGRFCTRIAHPGVALQFLATLETIYQKGAASGCERSDIMKRGRPAIIAGAAKFGSLCPLGSIGDPVESKLALAHGFQMTNLTLAQPLDEMYFQADCRQKTLALRSSKSGGDSFWQANVDGSFDILIEASEPLQFTERQTSSVSRSCTSKALQELQGQIDCTNPNYPVITMIANWWLDWLPEMDANSCKLTGTQLTTSTRLEQCR